MNVIIELLEGDWAVVRTTDMDRVRMPRILVPPEADTGSVLSIELEALNAKRRRADTSARIEELWKD